ncbi:ABC transporter permease [Jatrophihabitans sp. YIM 134969]
MTTPVQHATVPAAAGIAWSRVGLELRLFARDRQAVVFGFLYPALMMVIFGSVFDGQSVPGGITYPSYFLPGIAATGIMLTSFQGIGTSVATERRDGTLARLQALPMPPWCYFAGKVGLVVVSTVGQLALLLLVARLLFDVPLPVDSAHWLTFAWVALLGAVAGTTAGIAASRLAGSPASAGVVFAAIALVLQFFSGVFFVYSELPGWMQQVAALFPLKWMTQGLRSATLPDAAKSAEVAGSWEHGLTAVVLAVWIVLAVVVSVRTFRWRRG